MLKLQKSYKKIIVALLSFAAILVAIGPTTFAPVDADSLKLNFSVISDTHVGTIVEDARGIILSAGLRDMAKAEVKSDALVICGDLTERAMGNEYEKLSVALKAFCKADNLLLEMGNHDIRGLQIFDQYLQPYEVAADRYRAFMADTADIDLDTIYYYKIIKDCYFIVLNTEALEGSQTYISPTQIAWMDNLLAQARSFGNPVFIINHQPMAAIGDEGAELKAVMQKYDGMLDIFFLTGHYHSSLDVNTITNEGTVFYVSMPSYGKAPKGSGYLETGSGFQVELYGDEIIFRARDFSRGDWLSEYDRTIELVNSQG